MGYHVTTAQPGAEKEKDRGGEKLQLYTLAVGISANKYHLWINPRVFVQLQEGKIKWFWLFLNYPKPEWEQKEDAHTHHWSY